MTSKDSIRSAIKSIPGATWLVRVLRHLRSLPPVRREGPVGVRLLGHRAYVGGLWNEIGRLQFEFLLAQGLQPRHYFLDIACGSLRAGVHFISYLERSHYLGIEKETALLQAGVENELGAHMKDQKQPELVVSKSFEFQRFSVRPQYALAHSLFTHLPAPVISECLTKLREFIRDDGVLYATFNEVAVDVLNPDKPHDHDNFQYTRSQMEQLGRDSGWKPEYIGGWNHPRNSKMMRFNPA